MEDDGMSTFSYDGEGECDMFSLSELQSVVDRFFLSKCQLKKLAQGGYHKIYNVLLVDNTPLNAVVRVACPAFPRDKMESEVATCKFLAAFTSIPIPRIYTWNSDASNPVGAEYMIMDKVPGTSARDIWDTLSEESKKNVVSQIAHYHLEIFSLRFRSAGSLYLDLSSAEFCVGPIVSTPFYRALDGLVRTPGSPPSNRTDRRGPFLSVSQYISSFLQAELDFISLHRSLALSELQGPDSMPPESRLEQGQRVIRKALELCSIYPGDHRVPAQMRTPDKPFSLKLDDFRLSNIMIDADSGRVTGLIDFEGATIAPVWECAVIPRWLQEPHDPESSHEGGSAQARSILRATFVSTMGESDLYEEWDQAYKMGRPFRQLTDRLIFQVNVWASVNLEKWVDERLEWAKCHPGIGFPETKI